MTEKIIKEDSRVVMHYTLRLRDDSIADSSLDHDKPSFFVMGEDYISPEFERQLLGMKKGEKKRIYLNAVDAFGEVLEQLIYALPREKFSHLDHIEEGAIIAFTFPNQGEQAGIIRQVNEGLVVVDFNHPLAGQNLMFDVQIVE